MTGSNGQGGNLILGVTRSGSQADLFGAPVTPGLGPIRDLQVNSVDALNAVSGATTTPSSPGRRRPSGTPDEYLVSLYESSTGMVLEAYTPSTTFPVPPGDPPRREDLLRHRHRDAVAGPGPPGTLCHLGDAVPGVALQRRAVHPVSEAVRIHRSPPVYLG